MAKKQVIRLTESDLHKIIKESVKRVLNEGYTLPKEGWEALDVRKQNIMFNGKLVEFIKNDALNNNVLLLTYNNRQWETIGNFSDLDVYDQYKIYNQFGRVIGNKR